MINHLDGQQFYEACVSGARAVSREREYLNRINVFPVPDGDTGNNLSMTLNTLATVTPHKSFRESMQAIARATLAGARGNSGVIFAGFVSGMAYETADCPTLSTRHFASIVSRAVPHAYKSISNPVEGTMITVMREWASAVEALGERTTDFVELFSATIEVARASLEATPQKLKVLKDALVVDSGAKGFVLFLEGFAASLARTAESAAQTLTDARKDNQTGMKGEDKMSNQIPFRYCCEAFLLGDSLDIDEIRAFAEPLGDSLVVAGSPTGVKLHMHSNDPQELFMGLAKRGEIASQKVDDMLRQHQMIHDRLSPIALVTDSIADLPEELLDQYQVHQVPLNIVIDGNGFLDKLTIRPDRFYNLLSEVKEYPTSSQPNLVMVSELFERLKEHYESIIVISVSRELSGTHSVFEQASRPLAESGYPITVINSKLNSGIQGLLVLRAARLIADGRSHDEVVRAITEDIPRSKIYVSVVDFASMVRGGRVSPLKGTAGRLLNMRPIVSLDEAGKGIAFGTAFSQSGVMKKIVAMLRETAAGTGIEAFAVVHSNAPGKAQSLVEEVSEVTGLMPSFISEISPIVGISAGRDAVALCLVQGKSGKGD